jgi:hypothetical protein
MNCKKFLISALLTTIVSVSSQAQVDSNFHCYLLFGQSNMAGGGAISDSAPDCDTTPRIQVLAFSDCTVGPDCKNYTLKRTHDQWSTAFPPLHDCSATLEGICPGDWFAKTMIDSVSENIKIGLIPCALSGMALNVFLKNSGAKSTVGPPAVNGKNAYDWVVSRCKIAQKTGVIKGMLLHQGESGTGSSQAWDAMAIQIFNDLKADLKLDPKTPAVVGQLRSDNTAPAPQYNAGTNALIAGMPSKYQYCAAALSTGLKGNGKDIWHFNPSSMRELGKRYARGLLSVASPAFIPRKGSVANNNKQIAISQQLKNANNTLTVYTIDGRIVRPSIEGKSVYAIKMLKSRGVYIISYRSNDGRTAVVPYIK